MATLVPTLAAIPASSGGSQPVSHETVGRRTLNLRILCLIAFAPATAFGGNCFEASIRKPTPFMGNHGEVFQLDDGSFWEVQYEYEYLYEYYPTVVVCPEDGVLIIHGEKLNISPVAERSRMDAAQEAAVETRAVIESKIDGDFEGWEGETIVKLMNGQIWQQATYHYEYHYAFMPEVLIYRSGNTFKMKVEGTDEAVAVERLK